MKWIKRVLRALSVLVAGVLVWGVVVEPRLIDREDETVSVPRLGSEWDGKTVAVIGDIQIGMWLANTSTVERIVKDIRELRPAFVLIAGDFVYHPGRSPREEVAEVVDLLRPLGEAEIPTYAVLGNHDFAAGTRAERPRPEVAEAVADGLKAIGVRVLANEAVVLSPPGQSDDGADNASAALRLVGIGSWVARRSHPAQALREVPASAPRLVLMHHPNSFADLPAGAAPVAFAGHTHGGQVRVPLTPDWTWMSYAAEDKVHLAGWIDGYGARGNRLYINRGIGFSVAPVRFNARPELTLVTLEAGQR